MYFFLQLQKPLEPKRLQSVTMIAPEHSGLAEAFGCLRVGSRWFGGRRRPSEACGALEPTETVGGRQKAIPRLSATLRDSPRLSATLPRRSRTLRDSPGLSRDDPGLFRDPPGLSRDVPALFRDSPGCSRGLPDSSAILLDCPRFSRLRSFRGQNMALRAC